jgi:hypothetical protein
MELRWTRHAEEKRLRFRIDEADVAAAITVPSLCSSNVTPCAIRRSSEGRGIAVVIKRGTFPPRVITVLELTEEWLP